jgi:hypothetical protein
MRLLPTLPRRLPALVATAVLACLLVTGAPVPAGAAPTPTAGATVRREPERVRRADDYREVFDQQELAGSGAWSWFADPRAVYHQGIHRRTYTGWIDRSGNIKISGYDHDTLVRTTAVVASRFSVDDHNNPSILVLGDGRLLVFWSGHAGKAMFMRRSARPEDVTAWEPVHELGTNLPGSQGYTYPNPVRLTAEGGRIWLFWRGGNFNPAFSTSDDDGQTWSPARQLVTVPGQRPYMKVDSNGVDTITFAFTDAHPRSLETSVYSMTYKAGGFFEADGTRIGGLADLPFTPDRADKVYDAAATGVRAWVHDVALDAEARPVITFAALPGETDHRYHYARWTGDHWLDVEMTPAGGAIIEDPVEQYYSGGVTLDHEDPSIVYLSRKVGEVNEIERWSTTDGGTTWTAQPVTSGSAANNFRPVSPRGLPPGEDLEVIWMTGSYPSYTNFATLLKRSGASRDNEAPTAVFAPLKAADRFGVELDAGGSRDSDGTVRDYAWDFGDGTTDSGRRSHHTYAATGVYPVVLKVTDDDGQDDVSMREVTVIEPVPTALRISARPNPLVPGDDVTIGGRLVRADNPNGFVPGGPIDVLRRPVGSAEWVGATTMRTPANGLIEFVDQPTRDTEYLLRFAGDSAWGPSTSPSVTVRLNWAAAVSPSSRKG